MEGSDYLTALRKSGREIIVSAIVAAAVAVLVTLLLPKTYVSEARVLVAANDSSVDVFGTVLPELTGVKDNSGQTEAEVMRGRSIVATVVSTLGLAMTPEQLEKQVTVSQAGPTQVVSISVRSGNAAEAARIADAMAAAYLDLARVRKRASLGVAIAAVATRANRALDDVVKLDAAAQALGPAPGQATRRRIAADRLAALSTKLDQLRLNRDLEQGWGVILDPAAPATGPTGPGVVTGGLIGLLAGLLFGIGVAVYRMSVSRGGAS